MKKRSILAGVLAVSLVASLTPKPAHALAETGTTNSIVLLGGGFMTAVVTFALCTSTVHSADDGWCALASELLAFGLLVLDSHGNPTPDLVMPTTSQAKAAGLTAEEFASLQGELSNVNAINESITDKLNGMINQGATPGEARAFGDSAWKSDSAALAPSTRSAVEKIISYATRN